MVTLCWFLGNWKSSGPNQKKVLSCCTSINDWPPHQKKQNTPWYTRCIAQSTMSNRSRRGNSTHSPNGSNSQPKSKRNSSNAKRHSNSPPPKSGRTRGSKNNSPPKSGKRRSDFERKKEQLKRRRGGGGHNGHGGNRSKSSRNDLPPKIKKEKKKRRSKLAKFFSKMCGTGPIALDFSLNDDALRHVERAGLIPDEVRKLRHCFSMIDYDESGDVGKNFHCFFEYRCTTKWHRG